MNATTVRVTVEHISAGEPGDPHWCALSLAVRDALKAEGANVAEVEVTDEPGEWTATVAQRDAAGYRRFEAELDEEAVEFVTAFDAEFPVGPIETEFTWREIEP